MKNEPKNNVSSSVDMIDVTMNKSTLNKSAMVDGNGRDVKYNANENEGKDSAKPVNESND